MNNIREISITDNERRQLDELLNDLKNKLSQEYNLRSIARARIDVTELLPRYIVEFKHEGSLKILAFSDYRTQNLEEIIKFVKNLNEKPDLIVYAGDDLNRFAPMPIDFISKRSPSNAISEVTVHNVEGIPSTTTNRYGFIVRLPKHLSEDYLMKLFESALTIVREICRKFSNRSVYGIQDIRRIVENLQSSLHIDIEISEGQKGSKVSSIAIIDSTTGVLIVSVKFDKRYYSVSFGGLYTYLKGLNIYCLEDLRRVPISKVYEDDIYMYYYLPSANKNYFEELAKYSRYGVLVVRGNDGSKVDRALIYGNKVYDLHKTIVKIGSFVFVGFEGPYYFSEETFFEHYVKIRFEFVKKLIGADDKIVIVSHIPPKGFLDRAERFGHRSVGSLTLRQIMEENRKLKLIICGHVHACGGRYTTFDGVIIANVSSHDSVLDRANVALITLHEGMKPEIRFEKIPSLIEQEFERENLELILCTNCYSVRDIEAFRSYVEKHYPKIFDDLKYLADIKNKYGLPWSVVFEMYDKYGISCPEQLSDDVFQKLMSNSKGVYRSHIRRAYAKFKREHSQEIYLLNPLPLKSDKIILFDVEYDYDWVLFGFLDLNSGEIKQFWKLFDEGNIKEYVCSKVDYTFVHWGGRDKSFLIEICPNVSTLNLHYFVQTNLVAPLNSTELKEVHDVLCGHVRDEWWSRYFYNMDGFDKAILCKRVADDPYAEDVLAEANKADLLALKKVFKKLKELPVKMPKY